MGSGNIAITLALHGQLHALAVLYLGKTFWGKRSIVLWRRGCEGPRAGLAVVARSNSRQPCRNTNWGNPVPIIPFFFTLVYVHYHLSHKLLLPIKLKSKVSHRHKITSNPYYQIHGTAGQYNRLHSLGTYIEHNFCSIKGKWQILSQTQLVFPPWPHVSNWIDPSPGSHKIKQQV
jgi:hypothetical protein